MPWRPWLEGCENGFTASLLFAPFEIGIVMKKTVANNLRLLAAASCLFAVTTAALAGPIFVFSTSVGTQPSNVGTITLTQVTATTVDVLVDLLDTSLPLPRYGFVNTGGPQTDPEPVLVPSALGNFRLLTLNPF